METGAETICGHILAIIGGQIDTSGILRILNQPPNGQIVIEVRYIHTIIRKQKSKEASTEPSGDNITNVQEYVQYRSKRAQIVLR